jgi:hypothetical protein
VKPCETLVEHLTITSQPHGEVTVFDLKNYIFWLTFHGFSRDFSPFDHHSTMKKPLTAAVISSIITTVVEAVVKVIYSVYAVGL